MNFKKIFICLVNLIFLLSVSVSNINTYAECFSGEKEKDAELLYQKVNEFVNKCGTCNIENFDDICRDYIKENCKQPILLDKNEFEKKALNKLVLYRGVSEKRFADAFKRGEIYLGEGRYNQRGCGIYTTNNINLAKQWFGNNDDKNVVKMFFKKRANFLENDYLEKIKDIIFKLHPNDFFDHFHYYYDHYDYYCCKNSKNIRKSKMSAVLHNNGLLAKLVGYDILHSHYCGDVDSTDGVYTQEYLILDPGVLTISK